MEDQAEPLKRLLLRMSEAASVMGISEAMAWKMRKDGLLPVVKVGKRGIRVSTAALEKLIAEGKLSCNGR